MICPAIRFPRWVFIKVPCEAQCSRLCSEAITKPPSTQLSPTAHQVSMTRAPVTATAYNRACTEERRRASPLERRVSSRSSAEEKTSLRSRWAFSCGSVIPEPPRVSKRRTDKPWPGRAPPRPRA